VIFPSSGWRLSEGWLGADTCVQPQTCDSGSHPYTPLCGVAARKLRNMAVAALTVAIIAAVTGLGSLLWQFATWKRSGWDLDVMAYWDFQRQEVVAHVTNTGRQECTVSEVWNFVYDTSGTAPSAGKVFPGHGLPAPLTASAESVFTRAIPDVPKSFTLEVWVWTGGKPYKSQKYKVVDSADQSVGSGDGHTPKSTP
jgi:hypothetical protein